MEERVTELQLSKAWYRAVFEAAVDAIITINETGCILTVNPATEKLFGYSVEEMIGQNVSLLMPSPERDRHGQYLDNYCRTGTKRVIGIERETVALRKDGTTFPIRLVVSETRIDGQRMFIGQLHDITERKQAEDELKTILRTTMDGFYFVDLEGRILETNDSYCSMIGYSREELLGMSVKDIEAIETEDVIKNRINQIMARGWDRFETKHKRKDGSMIVIEASCNYLDYPESRLFCFMRDITARKQAEADLIQRGQQLELLSSAGQLINTVLEIPMVLRQLVATAMKITGALDGTAALLVDGKMVFREYNWSGKIEEIDYQFDPGYGVPGWVMQTVAPYVSNDAEHDAHVIPEIQKALGFFNLADIPIISRQGELLGCFEIHNKAGGFTEIDVILLQSLAASASIALENSRILAERRQAEESLKKAKEAAEEANQAKDQFIAMLSHELRTPLTPVLLSSTALEEDEEVPENIRGELRVIRRNVELEIKLIDDLLDVTRIRRGMILLHQEVVDAHACFRNALEICQSDIDAKRLHVSLRLEADQFYVWADPARLQQVFWNLIRNAMKFTPEGGEISILSANIEGRLRMVFSDTGIGIDHSALPRIFNAFEQAEQGKARRFGGLGLGLNIAKAVVELHHGTLTAFSEGMDKGSTFTLEMATVSDAKVQPVVPREIAVRRNGLRRILLVEDNADTLRVLARILQKWGYTVRTADCVRSALEEAAKEPFDLLVSDIGLPDGSGLEIMRQVQSLYGVRGLAISGFGTEEDIRQSRAAGFGDHLIKPVNIQVLHASIQQIGLEQV